MSFAAGHPGYYRREPSKGRYIVAYRLNRSNARRHEEYRSDNLEDAVRYMDDKQIHWGTARRYNLYSYRWEVIL